MHHVTNLAADQLPTHLRIANAVSTEICWTTAATSSTRPPRLRDFPPRICTLLCRVGRVEVSNVCPASPAITATHSVHVTVELYRSTPDPE